MNAFHALGFSLCILLAWYIFLHHDRLDTGKGSQACSPMPVGNWAPTILRNLVLSEGSLLGGILSSALRLQGHCVVQIVQTLSHKIPTGIPTGLAPITHEDQCNAI